ncbi:MAG: hypothetical protein RXO36_08330 [Candidatus Nanopusillus acidilobi]
MENDWTRNAIQLFLENGFFSFLINPSYLWTKEKELTQLIGVDPQKEEEENGFVELKYTKPYQDYLKVLTVKGFENSEGLMHVLVIKGVTYVVGDP